jgi:hypothetical protein
MKIPVILRDNDQYDEVPDYLLSRLIDSGSIKSFRRSTGWVVIGRDPIREPGKCFYNGPERRSQRNRSCLVCPEMVGGICISTTCPDRHKQTKIYTSI